MTHWPWWAVTGYGVRRALRYYPDHDDLAFALGMVAILIVATFFVLYR